MSVNKSPLMIVMLMLTVVTLLVATAASASVDLRVMGSTVQVSHCQLIGREDVTYIADVHRYQ